MKDLTAKEIQLADSKSSEGLATTNQEQEVEIFLHGITDQLKWQELVSKWLAFERDYPIKGVFFLSIILAMSVLILLYLEFTHYGPPRGSCLVAKEGLQVQDNSTDQEE